MKPFMLRIPIIGLAISTFLFGLAIGHQWGQEAREEAISKAYADGRAAYSPPKWVTMEQVPRPKEDDPKITNAPSCCEPTQPSKSAELIPGKRRLEVIQGGKIIRTYTIRGLVETDLIGRRHFFLDDSTGQEVKVLDCAVIISPFNDNLLEIVPAPKKLTEEP